MPGLPGTGLGQERRATRKRTDRGDERLPAESVARTVRR